MPRAYELLFLMINLAQMNDMERILTFYKDFMNSLFPGISFNLVREYDSGEKEFPIMTLTRSWGWMEIDNSDSLSREELALIRNSISLLAIILENREMFREMSQKAEKASTITDQFFDLSPDLLCIATLDGYFIKLNQSWTDLLGWTDEELMAVKWNEYVHPEDRENTNKAVENLSKGRQIFSFENRYRSKGGEYYWLSWNSEFHKKEGYIFAIARDITREKIIQSTNNQNDKLLALGQLAGGVAHDFNNQLTGISGFAELAQAEVDSSSALNGYLENIITSVNHSKDLTYQLLAYARRGNEKKIPVNLGDLVQEVSTILKRTNSPDIRINKEIDSDFTIIKGDPSQIQNMLLNLGINACDAMEGGGTLTFRIFSVSPEKVFNPDREERTPGELFMCLQVCDTGTGIPLSRQNKIFDPFFTTKPLHKGTGIGLSAVLGTVKSHNGYLKLDSEPGKGTTFSLYFPLWLPDREHEE